MDSEAMQLFGKGRATVLATGCVFEGSYGTRLELVQTP